ncbi:hypothetical protein IMSAGC005_03441 [Lachnospiraceae bacterium]|nr:hypothetical protein IMSAGC005_03441 [Lachnospiraceae bacterium]
MRKKVFICSPFRSDMEGNARKAAAYSRMACEEGHLPIAPHFWPMGRCMWRGKCFPFPAGCAW